GIFSPEMHLFFELALISLLYLSATKANICFDCVVIIEFVENLILNDEDNIEDKFNARCLAQFPDSWNESVCEALVKTKLDQIVQGIEDNLVPDQICNNIGLCNLAEFIKTLKIAVPAARPVVNLPVH
ncbi:hypothetical protein PFISCL1PPCAC_4951, partial [Pristionchus fissidentatus]